MATAKWSSPASAVTVINGDATAPTLKNLASAARKLGNEQDGATSLNLYAAFELLCRFASLPASGSVVSMYFVKCLDGTNYEDGSDSVTPNGPIVRVFPIAALTTQQRIMVHHVLLPPFKFKPLIVNTAGVAMTNTDNENVLKMRTYEETIT